MIHYGDITKIHGYDMPAVDVVTGGSPCQDLSVAGRRTGFEGERSVLFLDQIRIIREMRERDEQNGIQAVELRRPRFMVWENVPGAFSSRKGQDFKAVLEESIRVAEPEAPDLSVPEKGWPEAGLIYDELGGMVGCLASTQRKVLGSSPAKTKNRSCRRFCWTQCRRSII